MTSTNLFTRFLKTVSVLALLSFVSPWIPGSILTARGSSTKVDLAFPPAPERSGDNPVRSAGYRIGLTKQFEETSYSLGV